MDTDKFCSLSQEGIAVSEDDLLIRQMDGLYNDGISEESEDLELRDFEDDFKTGPVATVDGKVDCQNGGSGDHTVKSMAVALHDEDMIEEEIGSDEEKEILKGIRDEIENKVREEMKDELDEMNLKLKAIESGELPSRPMVEEEKEDSTGIDPKLKEAMNKMNKLDRILKKKIKKERQVKRSRLLLERRMREEINGLQLGSTNYREIKTNTERFLALAPPPSHNEGINIDDEIEKEDDEIPPLFSTQIYDVEGLFDKGNSEKLNSEDLKEQDEYDQEHEHNESTSSNTKSKMKTSGKGGKGKKPKKDFIKRNKELAADADQPIAMTDDEKKRLQDLLCDVDDIADGQETTLQESILGNAFQMSLIPGEGFRPDNLEQKSLTNIEKQLQAIMPEDNYRSIVESSGFNQSATSQHPMFSHVPFLSGGEIPERFGEKVLYETKEERELKAKLESIEEQLDRFKAQDNEMDGQAQLTDDQLDSLLNQCVRDISRMSHVNSDVLDTPDLSARSTMSSSRQSLSQMENLPRLTDSQLQQLLSEAHFPLSSTLLSLRDDDQKIAEEQGNAEKIKAETWKAISEEDLETEKLIIDAMTAMDNEGNISQNASNDFGDTSNHKDSWQTTKSFESDRMLNIRNKFSGASDSGEPQFSSSLSTRNSTGETLPKINPNMSAWTSFSLENTPVPPSVTPSSSIHMSQNGDFGSEDSVRLPDIQSHSFLIQTPQGMNNESRKGADNLSSRKSIQRLHNDLTDSMSTVDLCDDAEFSHRHKTSNCSSPNFVPKPPSKEVPQIRTTSRP